MTDQKSALLNAQVAVLGCLLIDPEHTAGEIMASVQDQDFPTPDYRMIFQAARKIFSAGHPIDAVAINDALGGSYTDLLMQIMDVTPSARNYKEYIAILHKAATLSQLQEIGATMSTAADIDTCTTALSEAQMLLADQPGVRTSTMPEALDAFYKLHDPDYRPEYLTWGIDKLDGAIHASPGAMIVIGGYPSDGKTSLAARFAFHMAAKKRVGFFSYETSIHQLYDRIIAMTTGIGLPAIQSNTLTADDWDTVAALSAKLSAANLEIIEASGMSVSQIRARSLARRYDVIFIDYLQKIAVERGFRAQSSFDAVSQISSDLQQLGRQTGIYIVALSQFSRAERAKDGVQKPPSLSSLRQSGQIEQDADVVMLLHRENPDEPVSRRILRVAKNKDGEANVGLMLEFDGPTQRFRVSAAPVRPAPGRANKNFAVDPSAEIPAEFWMGTIKQKSHFDARCAR